MKKAVNLLLFGCVFGAIAAVPAFDTLAGAHVASHTSVGAAPGLAVVSGTIRDNTGGTPVIGALVSLLEPHARGKEIKSLKTDGQGRFTTGIVPGAYRMRVVADGFMPTFTRINLDRAVNQTYHLKLKRNDTLVQKRGDSDDYRWIGGGVPRNVLHFDEPNEADQPANTAAKTRNALTNNRPQIHGTVQLLAVNGLGNAGQSRTGNHFYGTNFALSSSLGGVEMALIGQRGTGQLAPQRLAAIATMRPRDNHQVTAMIGYGQMSFEQAGTGGGALADTAALSPLAARRRAPGLSLGADVARKTHSLDQVSISATDEWQIFQPLLLIYGFDYSRFVSSASAHQQDSVLPRVALQYTPSAQWRMSAAVTPGTTMNRLSPEGFKTENLNTQFETQVAESALLSTPLLDRSRRMELGVERIFGDGAGSLETSAFYDIIAGHGVGVLALPLEVTPATQQAFQQVALMNGAARGARLMAARRLNDYATVSAGYSVGYGSRFNQGLMQQVALQRLTPAQVFQKGFFQVAAAKLDLDFTQKSGTRVSTVIRLSPAAVVFAIDPFAGRMSVYDPNINIYVTQELPTFGLPLQCQALVDVRNLLNQSLGLDDGNSVIATSRSQRTVRGGIAIRW